MIGPSGTESLLNKHIFFVHHQAQFNDKNHFIHYNMFNHYFFDKDTGKTLLQNFFQKSTPKSIAVVMDPPFGGLVQVIATNLRKMWKFVCKDKGNI